MTICDRFDTISAMYPERIALISENEGSITYKELNDYSNQIALMILKDYAFAENVGVLMYRSFSLIASIIGIMKAGKAYVPLDPNYPENYMTQMMGLSRVRCVLCMPETSLLISRECEGILVGHKETRISTNVSLAKSTDTACILFTSGSTGTPNGVVMTHESILNTIDWAINFYQLSTQDVDMQIPSCSFTSSVQDIFSTLLSGGTLVIVDEKKMLNARYLNKMARSYGVTHFDMVPSLYKEYLSVVESSESTLRFVLLAGEPLSIELAKAHFSKLANVRLVNEYGMAETCSCAFYKEIMPTDTSITIGRAITNMIYCIAELDDEGVGELWISGKGLAKGYFRNEAYTQEKFVDFEGVRYLRTGDFVRECNNRELEYIARKDQQIKVNGKRVNLHDIDTVLMRDQAVNEVCTIVLTYGEKRLIVSYIDTDIPDVSHYWELLKKELPNHAVPNFIKLVKGFPYLPNKKRNIKMMQEMFIEELNQKKHQSSIRYQRILDIIYDATEGIIDELDIEKDIRLQGVDSLTFIRIIAMLEDEYDFEFGYDDLENMEIINVKTLYDYVNTWKE